MIGYLHCRDCGQERNCADLVGGLCPTCARKRVARLADLQVRYQAAVDAGEPGASSRVAELIRLKDVPAAYRVV